MERLVVLTGTLLMVAGCQSEPSDNQVVDADVSTPSPAVEATQEAAIKPPLIALGRTELIAAFASAADAIAAGRPLPDANRQLVGRTFTLRLPFGCNGPVSKERPAWAGWSFDQKRQALKLSATPERWSETDWVRSIAGAMDYEAVEGFWIQRPWTSSEDCPVKGDLGTEAAAAAAVERPTVGIAQFFAPGSSRKFQRGSRAYSHTSRVRDTDEIKDLNYRLSVTGRVVGFTDGQPVHCWQESTDLRPVCLLAVELARIAFEDAPAGNVLVEWQN